MPAIVDLSFRVATIYAKTNASLNLECIEFGKRKNRLYESSD